MNVEITVHQLRGMDLDVDKNALVIVPSEKSIEGLEAILNLVRTIVDVQRSADAKGSDS